MRRKGTSVPFHVSVSMSMDLSTSCPRDPFRRTWIHNQMFFYETELLIHALTKPLLMFDMDGFLQPPYDPCQNTLSNEGPRCLRPDFVVAVVINFFLYFYTNILEIIFLKPCISHLWSIRFACDYYTIVFSVKKDISEQRNIWGYAAEPQVPLSLLLGQWQSTMAKPDSNTERKFCQLGTRIGYIAWQALAYLPLKKRPLFRSRHIQMNFSWMKSLYSRLKSPNRRTSHYPKQGF